MSQSNNPKDTQALLQSMLQRLRLQPGREGQAFLQSPAPVSTASTPEQDRERGVFNLQTNRPVNGFKSAADSNFERKGGEIQQPSHGCEPDGLISFPTQKDNTDDDKGEKAVSGQATGPEITPTGTRQLFPPKSLTDADITSFDRTDTEKVTNRTPSNKDVAQSMRQNQEQNECFTPKVYAWSLTPTNASPEAGSEGSKMLHMGNGGFEASAESKDMQFVASSQNTANSSFRRKQRSSENKTTRWTQKLKDRWRDRQESFRKKSKQGGSVDQKSEQVTELSSQNQLLTADSMINTSNKEEERTLPSLDGSESSKTPPAHTQDSSFDRRSRSYSDFEFGLGSFSLLEEIVMGQEWAKFLNPNLPATSVSQRPLEEPLGQFQAPPNPYGSVQTSVIYNQQEGGSNQYSYWSTGRRPGSNLGMPQTSPVACVHGGSMEVSESVHREADQSEPMDDGHNQPDVQPRERRVGQQRRPASVVQLQSSDLLDRSRAQMSRKRHHQSAERGDDKEAGRERSMSAPSMTSFHEMDESGSQHDSVIPLYSLKPPTPLSPSSFNPFAPAPRSVLKHSISQDSESSMETTTKRRRVEENRRVRFSEDVVAIEPQEVDVDVDCTDSEDDDSGAEEDSVTEQECEVEQAPVQEAAPARRHNLPAWIQALKRKNTGRKHR